MQNPENGLILRLRRGECECKKLACMVIVAGKFKEKIGGKNKKFLSGQEVEELHFQEFSRLGHWE